MPSFVKDVQIDISDSTTVSDPIDIGYGSEVAFQFPAAMTGTAMTFQASHDGVTYGALHDGTSAVSVAIAANLVVAPTGSDRDAFRAIRYLKLVSGTAELADRDIKVILTPRSAGR